jgi:hypothetical protein
MGECIRSRRTAESCNIDAGANNIADIDINANRHANS